MNKPT